VFAARRPDIGSLPSGSVRRLLRASEAASAQTREREPSLSDDERKPQQNSADEAGVKARLEDGIKPGDPKEQSRVSKKLEAAAVEAKRKSDAKAK
jgi:hypothetical protein